MPIGCGVLVMLAPVGGVTIRMGDDGCAAIGLEVTMAVGAVPQPDTVGGCRLDDGETGRARCAGAGTPANDPTLWAAVGGA